MFTRAGELTRGAELTLGVELTLGAELTRGETLRIELDGALMRGADPPDCER